jgi:hypothetical protein
MHKIDGLDATSEGRFQDPALGAGVLGTVLTAKWLNAVQEELSGLVERAGLTLDESDNAQVIQAIQLLYGSGVAGGALKNHVINGSFDLWQRGLSRAVSNVVTFAADRWASRADAEGSGSGTATLTRQSFAAGQTDVPGALHYLRWVQATNATAGTPALFQRIEPLGRYSGGNVSISFSVRAAASLACAAKCFQSAGAGGTADVTVGSTAFTATTTWTRHSFTFELPSLTGITLGANPNLRVAITMPTSATWTLEVADFQVELADESSAFDRRPPELEYLLASRYFQKSYPLDVTPGTDGGNPADARRGALWAYSVVSEEEGGTASQDFWYGLQSRLVVPMRATPTVQWYEAETGGATASIILQPNSTTTPSSLAVAGTISAADSSTGFPQTSTSNPGLLERSSVYAHWTADAEI